MITARITGAVKRLFSSRRRLATGARAALIAICAWSGNLACAQPLAPSRMPRIGVVDERFQSYNIEMVEVTGGRFWRPYGPASPRAQRRPARADATRFSRRGPIDLANPRLRRLAAALGPSYLRVSGTWANATSFSNSQTAPVSPPAGFDGVLTLRQWRGVIDFAKAADARLMTSFAVSAGARDSAGAWQPAEARRLIAATQGLGGRIAAAEFMNEPDLASNAPRDYDATDYARDFMVFRRLMREISPETIIAGPGSAAGSSDDVPAGLSPRNLLAASGGIDVVSYHHYQTLSRRCGGDDEPSAGFDEAFLARTDRALALYERLRDELAPGKPIWLTETADAACGGNPWDASFVDSFRYLDQLGRLAKRSVAVVMHNTLAGSDYGLLDEQSFAPRPSYWAALLWHRLMGATVLDPGAPFAGRLHLYAQCQRGVPGGVTLLAINLSRHRPRAIRLPVAAKRYTLSAPQLEQGSVRLNGRALRLRADDGLPAIRGAPTAAGKLILAPRSISFLTVDAANPACR